LCLTAVLVISSIGGCSGDGDVSVNDYVFASAERGRVESSVTATGTVNPVTSVQVGTYVSGPIRAIDVDFNSPVKRGQRVAKIDPAAFLVKVQKAEASVATARARVEKDRADLKLKKLKLERTRELSSTDLIAQHDVDTAQSEYDQAVSQLELDRAGLLQSSADLDEARINLAYTDITSPVDGVVVSRNVDVGQTVAATFQTPTLFLIAEDLTKMQVDTSVSESDIGSIRSGQRARFIVDAYPGQEFVGEVVQVRNAPTVILNVVTYDVVVAVANPKLELQPGMTANVTIITAERDDVLRIPIRALRFRPEASGESTTPRAAEADGAPHVWLQEAGGTLQQVGLQIGVRNDTWAEVVSGDLRAGAKIAVSVKRADQPTPRVQSIPGQPRFR